MRKLTFPLREKEYVSRDLKDHTILFYEMDCWENEKRYKEGQYYKMQLTANGRVVRMFIVRLQFKTHRYNDANGIFYIGQSLGKYGEPTLSVMIDIITNYRQFLGDNGFVSLAFEVVS